VVSGALQAGAAYLSVRAIMDGFNNSVDTLAKLDDMSQKTGSSVENLSRLQKVSEAFGQDFGAVDVAVSKLAKGMAGLDDDTNKAHKALDALGISSKDAAGNLRDPSEVMVEVAKKLQNYQDSAAKTALMNDLLGKSGAELLPYLNDLAENVDRFSGSSTAAAQKASELRDKMGLMRVEVSELYTSAALGLVPAFVDVIDVFNRAREESEKAAKSGDLKAWAEDLTGVFTALFNAIDNTVSGIQLAGLAAAKVAASYVVHKEFDAEKEKISPTNFLGFRKVQPGSDIEKQLQDISAREAAAQKAIEDGYEAHHDKILSGVDRFNRGLENLRKARVKPAADGSVADFMAMESGAAAPKKALNYVGGNEKKEKDKLSDYDKLLSNIREKIALDEKQIALGRPLTDAEKEIAKIQSDRATKSIKLTDAQMASLKVEVERQSVLDRVLQSRAETEKMDQERADAAQKEISSAFDMVDKLKQEVDMYGQLPSAISAATVAKLEALKTSLEMSGEALPEEIGRVNALIEANKRLAALQGRKEGLDENKKKLDEAAKEAQKILDNLHENIQRNLGDELFNTLDGNFENIGQSFGRMVKRMIADAASADLMNSLMGKSAPSQLGALGAGFMKLIGMGGGYQGAAGADGLGSVADFMAMDAAPSLDGGGFTGNGPRSGGIDGKGGFPAIMHPQETVIDHSRGQSVGGKVEVKVNIINNAQAQVTTRQSSDGGIEVLINALDDALGERAASGRGSLVAGLQSRFDMPTKV
jgi:hypothetical protein